MCNYGVNYLIIMYKEKEFNLKPQYIKNTGIEFKGLDLNEFQEFLLFLGKNKEDIQNLSNSITRNKKKLSEENILELINSYSITNDQEDKNVIFIHAPTGAGKTFGMLLPTLSSNMSKFEGRDKTIITEPTNSIIHELYEDIGATSKKLNEEINYTRITGEDNIDKKRSRLWSIPDALDKNDIILTNIDIVSLYISGFYLERYEKYGKVSPEKTKSWASLFRSVKIFVIDEYHSYSEESMARVLSLILLNKSTHNDVKFIFTSATPNTKFIEILKSYKINPKVINIKNDKNQGRTVRGNLKLIFTNKPLTEEVIDKNNKDTTLYMFDHKIDAEEFIYKLKESGINPREYTGFATRRQDKNTESVRENIIIGTNAVELGVNINPAISHIEPGKYYENFWQRLGRTGRGTNGTIYVHTSDVQYEEISKIADTDEYAVLAENLAEKLLLQERLFIARRVKANMAAFMCAVYKFASNNYIKDQVKEISNIVPSMKPFFKLFNLESQYRENNKQKLENWINTFFQNLGYFRGVTTSITIKLPDNKITTDDYIYSSMHYNMTYDKTNKIYIVNSFLRKNNKISVTYKGLYSSFAVDGQALYDYSKLSDKFIEDCESFFDDYDDDYDELKKLMETKLYDPNLISRNFFVPEEVVVENDDNIFL